MMKKFLFVFLLVLSLFMVQESISHFPIPLRKSLKVIAEGNFLDIAEAATPKLIIFYSPSCHKCAQVKNEVIPQIHEKFKDKISIEYRDTSDIENYKLLLSLREKYAPNFDDTVPVFYFNGNLLSSKEPLRENLEALINNSPGTTSHAQEEPYAIDLISRFKGFPPAAIASAGLIDGINPCAFTVIVFFISFLVLQGYRKRELIVTGLSFIFIVFLTYILIGIGIFSFLYRLSSFWLVARIFNISIGIFCIILGILALYDFFKFRKTGSSAGLALQLPQAVKNQIHKLIGKHYRKSKDKTQKLPVYSLVFTALITGFLVSILEAVCTGQVYLPTITFILKTAPLKMEAFGYLILYNLMFIFPLAIIFLFALWGVTSEQFSRVLKKHLLSIKIIMAILFFALGIFLIRRG